MIQPFQGCWPKRSHRRGLSPTVIQIKLFQSFHYHLSTPEHELVKINTLLSVIRHLSLDIRHSSFVIRYSSFVIPL